MPVFFLVLLDVMGERWQVGTSGRSGELGDMELTRGLLTLILLCIIPAGTADPQVLVTIPSVLKSGETAKVCLSAKRFTDNMNVWAVIEIGGTNHTVINDQLTPDNIFKAYDFQAPAVNDSVPVFLHISAVCSNYNFTARRSMVIARPRDVVFIRTDKEKYMGGQEVQISIMSVDNNLRPVEESFPAIYVEDPAGNRLHQWLDQSTNGAFLKLKFPILSDANSGYYRIVATRKSAPSVTKGYNVEPYVLPKFTLTMKTVNKLTVLDKNVSIEMSGRYTYDKGVPGNVAGRLCRPLPYYYPGNPCNRDPDGICEQFTGETDSEGIFRATIGLSTFQLDRSGYQMAFILQGTLTEKGTNVQVTETKTISITNQLGRAYFDNKVMPQYFKSGIGYNVRVIVENGQGQPESGQVVALEVNYKFIVNLTSDENGRAEYEIDTSELTATSEMSLQLRYNTQEQCYDSNWITPTYISDFRSVKPFYSRTDSYVDLQGPNEELEIGKKYNLRVRYILGKEALAEGETTLKFVYMIMSRAKIMDAGEHNIDVSQSLRGEFNLTYEASLDHVPIVQCAVYCMLKDEVLGDALNFNLENAFKNKVFANFSSKMGTPGSNVNLDVTATPKSACLTRVVDSSLLLLEQGQSFTAATVFNSLRFNSLRGYYVDGYNVDPPQPSCIDPSIQIKINGTYWSPSARLQEGDVSNMFSDIGMFLISDTPYQQPRLCSQPFERPSFEFARPMGTIFASEDASSVSTGTGTILASFSSSDASPATITSMRVWFPEFWNYGTTSVGENGFVSIPLVVPGTITQWKSEVMCLSNETGFGMTKYYDNFTSFQKMFVDLSFSNSIIRGEIMLLVGSVANYMDKCTKVRVSLQSSSYYTAEMVDKSPVKCVCPEERVTFSWKINATSIGVFSVNVSAETINISESCDGPADPNEPKRVDIIVKNFTVESDGVKQDVTKTDFVCVKDGTNKSVQVNINPSGNIVPGSLAAKIQLIGNMLGRALIIPESLIVKPMGCGEQNLAKLMPIANVLRFLNITGRLTEELDQRGRQYIRIGYMRQLQFKLYDGSFSAFGPGRSTSSGWLTVKTMRTFAAIKDFTFVDEKVTEQAILFLARLQNLPTGGFTPVGTLFNNELGGASDDVAFTCEVAIFLTETSHSTSPTLLRPALMYLEAASQKDQPLYNMAMLFYVFRVTGNKERANAMLAGLMSKATDTGEYLYWLRPVRPKQRDPYLFSPRPPSRDIETTAIVLKALTYGEMRSTVSTEDLNKMAKISNWLIVQQNVEGSYSTTSDTVATVDGLCSYAALVYQEDAAHHVLVKNGGNTIREFNVDNSNRMVLQTEVLTQVPGNYIMEVSGNGCILLQTGVTFNVPIRQENSPFTLSLTTFPDDCSNGVAYAVNILVKISFNGDQKASNMTVIEIPYLSGYSIEQKSLTKLKSTFPRVEEKNSNLIVYFDEMTSNEVSFPVTLEMGSRVFNFQQRIVVFYDYYETDLNTVAALNHPCVISS